jgi:hypothetical protein
MDNSVDLTHSKCQFLNHARFKALESGLAALAIFTGLAHFQDVEAGDTFKEKVTGTELPKTVSFTRRGRAYDLEATGGAVRRKWFTNGYVISHYMQDPVVGTQEAVLKDVFSDEKAKQMTIVWLHRLPVKLIRDSFRESLEKVMGAEEELRLKDAIDKFVNFFKADAEVQDSHYIRWFPGGDIELWYRSPDADKREEKLGSLVSVGLARALWTIWLGPSSVVDRNEMLQFAVRK